MLTTNTMSVRQLIEKLQEFPPDMPVGTEGCDCFGDVVDVSIYRSSFPYLSEFDVVMLWRDPPEPIQTTVVPDDL